jgi:hypothetical protein
MQGPVLRVNHAAAHHAQSAFALPGCKSESSGKNHDKE